MAQNAAWNIMCLRNCFSLIVRSRIDLISELDETVHVVTARVARKTWAAVLPTLGP